MRLRFLALAAAAAAVAFAGRAAEPADPFAWLEDIDSPRALAWVAQQNAATAARLSAAPEYAALHRDALRVLDSATRLPDVSLHGGYLYDLWRDAAHPRGVFRRTTPEQFRSADTAWETVLDIDALAASEGRPWAFGGAIWPEPDNGRCLIELSPGGGDAVEIREFDLNHPGFVASGSRLPVAKSRVAWAGADALYVATDFGPDSLTSSGYPRIVKRWQRGTPLASATTLHVGDKSSVSSSARRYESKAGNIDVVTEGLTFWTAKCWQLIGDKLERLAIPPTAKVVDAFDGQLVLWLKNDWTFARQVLPAAAVVAVDPAVLRAGKGKVDLVVAPTADAVVVNVDATPTGLLVTMLDDVRGRLFRFVHTAFGWKRERVRFPDNGTITVATTNHDTGEAYVRFETFLTPPTLYRLAPAATVPEPMKAQAPAFDAAPFAVQQLWAVSADGTRVPYFVVGPKELKHDGGNPVWMFSYGGFEIPLTPSYSGSYEDLHGAYGRLWLACGGVFVLANIRGGGEFGPQWHQAALKENHVKAFEDFEAVARDLITRHITSPAHLGIEGRSNGGLLVAATMLRHPELYGAVVCGSPLLDMRRYPHLLAGASWMAEYGNPDLPADWAYLSRYSPYQNVRAGLHLPPVMFYTSTRDDRVHPGHARKMAARMESLGYPVEYYEITEGGHHGSVTNQQLATRLARTFTFLWEHVR